MLSLYSVNAFEILVPVDSDCTRSDVNELISGESMRLPKFLSA